MVGEITIGGIIKTSIVTAFTIATALIWKDIIMEIISLFVPFEKQLFYKLTVAIIATIVIVLIIYALLQAQKETEVVWRRYKDRKHREDIERKRIEKIKKTWKKKLKKEKRKREKLRKKLTQLKK